MINCAYISTISEQIHRRRSKFMDHILRMNANQHACQDGIIYLGAEGKRRCG